MNTLAQTHTPNPIVIASFLLVFKVGQQSEKGSLKLNPEAYTAMYVEHWAPLRNLLVKQVNLVNLLCELYFFYEARFVSVFPLFVVNWFFQAGLLSFLSIVEISSL